MKGIQILYFICFIMLLVSCSSTKFVGEGEYLLDKIEIVSDNKTYKKNELKPYLRQQPNFKAFGLMKWQLFVYDWSGRKRKDGSTSSFAGWERRRLSWIRRWSHSRSTSWNVSLSIKDTQCRCFGFHRHIET